jgi:hypothetical protein
MMQTLKLKIEASTNDEPYRAIADGTRDPNGRIEFATANEMVPHGMLEAFDRYLNEVQLTVGTWTYKSGDNNYKVSFTNRISRPASA